MAVKEAQEGGKVRKGSAEGRRPFAGDHFSSFRLILTIEIMFCSH